MHASLRTDLVHHGLEISRRGSSPREGQQPGIRAALKDFVAAIRGSDVKEIYLLVRTEALETMPVLLEKLRVIPLPIHLVPERSIATLVERSWKSLGASVAIEVQREPIGFVERTAKRVHRHHRRWYGAVHPQPAAADGGAGDQARQPRPRALRPVALRLQRQAVPHPQVPQHAVAGSASVAQAVRNDQRVTRVAASSARPASTSCRSSSTCSTATCRSSAPGRMPSRTTTFYDDHINDYAMRQHVKPGLTGWAQVNGHRGLTPTIESMARRVEHDLWYIDNWTSGST